MFREAAFLLLASCAISLDDAPRPTHDDAGVPQLAGCAIPGATGRVRSFTVGDEHLALADAVGTTEPALYPVGGACLDATAAPSPASATGSRLLDTFVAGSARYAYVQTDAGVGLARWNAETRRFESASPTLFTADRPLYGDAVVVENDVVYAYGCKNSGFLTDSCYVARVAAADLADRTAYRFWLGGGGFGDDIDNAWPLFLGGSGLAVTAQGARLYAVYATPLADRITVRSGLGPTGPWSAPYEVTRCELPAGGFCTAFSVHPGDPATLAVSYGIASFDPLPAEARTSRLVPLPLDALP